MKVSAATNIASIDADSQTTSIPGIDEPPAYKETGLIIDLESLKKNSGYSDSDSRLSLNNPPTYDSIEFDSCAKKV